MDEEVQALAARLVRRLKEVRATITIAESCTGGLLASTLTDIAGASEYFGQSWVCYSYESKINELNVRYINADGFEGLDDFNRTSAR